MFKSPFSRWCDQMWLYLVYLLGVAMTCYLLWNWAAFDLPQKLACMLAVAVPLHVFEENTFPGGFFYMNNMGFGSKEPMVYPQNRCTNMITNLGAEIVIIAVALNAATIEPVIMSLVVFFALGETVNHTRSGILMYRNFKDRGKRTVYGPRHVLVRARPDGCRGAQVARRLRGDRMGGSRRHRDISGDRRIPHPRSVRVLDSHQEQGIRLPRQGLLREVR